jgi:hypothetical protein
VVQPQVLGDDGADEGRHHQQHDLEERLPRDYDMLSAADARELRPRRLRLLALLSVHSIWGYQSCATRRDDDGQLGKLLARRDCPRFLAAGDFASVDRARDLSAAHAARKAP